MPPTQLVLSRTRQPAPRPPSPRMKRMKRMKRTKPRERGGGSDGWPSLVRSGAAIVGAVVLAVVLAVVVSAGVTYAIDSGL